MHEFAEMLKPPVFEERFEKIIVVRVKSAGRTGVGQIAVVRTTR
jgi:hypothetical protein